ncbi:hypothetical protein BD310DRAFT_958816 [Dichomitus squalens]|uniref:Uncharacterized protein n=1 Tax=Dichomitus squalens TaxID=114155 RepID=A0A4Q9PVN1_9APHY|nr:hypothetical protein BD310DRAFT_958816 [Dichomitus squalens]
MSTYNNFYQGTRTFWKAAATPGSGTQAPEPREFEAIGELPNSNFLPPAEQSKVTPVYPSPPLFAATDIELSVKWGIQDYDMIVDRDVGRRVTRKVAQAIREGAMIPNVESLLYRGHRRMRGGTPMASHPGTTPDVTVPSARSEIAVEADTRPEDDSEEDETTEVSTLLYSEDVQLAAEGDGIGGHDAVEGDLGADESSSVSSDQWKVVRARRSPEPQTTDILPVVTRYFPSWFDLCDFEDQLGPIPTDWSSTTTGSPILPEVQVSSGGTSLLDEFWQEVDSSDEDGALQRAIANSICTAEAEVTRQTGIESRPLEVMATLVEVISEEEKEPEAPTGQSGRYTSKQKGKHVPRTSQQREFLKQFVSGHTRRSATPAPERSDKKSSESKPVKTGPARFKRESSQVPDGGWFRDSTRGGGRGPPSSPSDSSSDYSESSSSSSDKRQIVGGEKAPQEAEASD